MAATLWVGGCGRVPAAPAAVATSDGISGEWFGEIGSGGPSGGRREPAYMTLVGEGDAVRGSFCASKGKGAAGPNGRTLDGTLKSSKCDCTVAAHFEKK
jgi:hypothetical protein